MNLASRSNQLLAEELRSSRSAPEADRGTLEYALTIFLGGFLLFEAEPMVAKYILPWYGGSAAVWTTCLLFFQVLVLAGYSYAHVIGTRLAPSRQARTHLAVIVSGAAVMLLLAIIWKSPILPGAAWKPMHSDFPIARILLTLCVSIGIPFFAISSTAPLLQSWLARTNADASPYRLYAWSNLGALLALLSYPFVIEPRLPLTTQANVWAGLYLLLVVGIARCAIPLLTIQSRNDATDVADLDTFERSTIGTRILWIALAACASVMLYGATGLMTHDVAPVPFLWILPLSLYMLSFVICFDSERWYRRAIFHPLLAAAIFASLVVTAHIEPIAIFMLGPAARESAVLLLQLSTSSALLFAVCMVCHGELYRLRPRTQDLTSYYLMVSAGGVVGGVFSAVLAPELFRGFWESRLAVWSCLLLMTIVLIGDRKSWIHKRKPVTAVLIAGFALILPEAMTMVAPSPQYNAAIVAVIIGIGLLALLSSRSAGVLRAGIATATSMLLAIVVLGAIFIVGTFVSFRYTMVATRDFYGVFRIDTNPIPENPGKYRYFELRSGAITHGLQFPDPSLRYIPTMYYGRETGLGALLMNFPRTSSDNSDNNDDPRNPRAIRIGVIGLGTGTIAAWGQTGDYIRFYELNPTIIKLATDPNGYFTYLSDSSAKVDIVEGDARISIENELRTGNPQRFDVLVLDAFAGDAIPMHLLTREAMRTWLAAITPDGVIAVHTSNRFLNLNPVLTGLARTYGLRAGWIHDAGDTNQGDPGSDWVLLARNNIVLGIPEIASKMKMIEEGKSVLWTDDYSNLFSVLQ